MRFENWLTELRRIVSRNVLATRRVRRSVARRFESLETRIVPTSPTVSSIIPDPMQPGANVSDPRFIVTFSESVTGVTPADFVAVPGAGVTVAPGPVVVTGSGTTYTVTVNGVAGTGTLGLNLVDDNSIRNGGGNRLIGNGDGTFQVAQNFATGTKPISVVVGDVNGDGNLDLAVANFQGDSVSVLLGNGNGTFQTMQSFATGSRPRSLAVADVNGDGNLDLVAANRISNTASVLLGNGNGTFQARQDFGVGNSPYSVAVGDVNGDGLMDLVAASLTADAVNVLLGNGNGTFQAAQSFATGDGPVSVVIGDVNGDGALDLATANINSSTASVLLGNGNGTFQAAQNFAAGPAAYSVSAGDVNGDGMLDLAVASRGSNTVSVLLGNGDGTFQTVQSFPTGSSPRSVSVRDVSGDGRLDLVTGNYASNTASVLLGNGNGTFQSAQNFATGSRPFSLAVGDVNGDGRPDLAVANYVSNTVSVLLNAANGNFTGQTRAVDTAAPTVTSVLRNDPLTAVTAADQLTFRVTFDEAVQNVSTGDFTLSGTSAADGLISSVTPVSTSVYDVLITGVDNSNGTIQLLFAAGQDITDLATNPLTNTTPTTSESYTVANNLAPTAVALQNTTTTLPENTNTASSIKLADIVVTDDALGTNALSLSGTDAAFFELSGSNELLLRANTVLNFEAKSTYDVTVEVNDAAVGGAVDALVAFTLTLTDVNEAPTAVSLQNTTTTLAENTSTVSAIKVADVSITDDVLGTNALSLSGTDAAFFEISSSNELLLRANTVLNFEAKSTYDVTVEVNDAAVGGAVDAFVAFTLTLTDVNEAPTAVSLQNTTTTLAENTSTVSAIKLADVSITDDVLGTNALSLSGTDAAFFEISSSNELLLRANTVLNFEAKSTYDVTVEVNDAAVGGAVDAFVAFTLTLTDVNEAPTAVSLQNTTTTLAENTSTVSAIKLANILVTDDAIGTNGLSLSGADAALFEISSSNELMIRANAVLDFEARSSLEVTVEVNDAAVGGAVDASTNFTLTLTNVLDTTNSADAFTFTFSSSNVAITHVFNGGSPVLVGTFPLNSPIVLDGLDAKDSVRVVGTSNADLFTVSATDLVVNDTPVTLFGSALRILAGGLGSDVYRFDVDTVLGAWTLDESGGGIDTINFSATTTVGVSLNMATAGAQLVHPTNLSLSLGSGSTFENAIGGSGSDMLIGNSLSNTLTGGAGDDQLVGGAGSDLLFGGANNDSYLFGPASAAEADEVTENFNDGIDTLNFGFLNTSVALHLGANTFQPVHTNRTLKLNSAITFENATGGTGADNLTGNTLNNTLSGGPGDDRLIGAAGSDVLLGGANSDTYLFGPATVAEADEVTESLGDGFDTLSFVFLTTDVSVHLGSNSVQTVHTNRTLKLSSAMIIENLIGGTGNDTLIGNSQNNTLTGGLGDDRLVGSTGNDVLLGGANNDTYMFGPASAAETDEVTESAVDGVDTLNFEFLTTDVVLNLGTNVVQTVHTNRTLRLNSASTFENAVGGKANDTLLGNALSNRLTDGVGDNVLVGLDGGDTLETGSGRDILVGGAGLDTLNGGVGDDIVIAGRTTSDTNPTNLATLRTAWISADPYETRITNLRAGVGSPLVSLKTTIDVLNDAGEDDVLTGGPGTDWFFRALDDTITDLFAGEIIDVL